MTKLIRWFSIDCFLANGPTRHRLQLWSIILLCLPVMPMGHLAAQSSPIESYAADVAKDRVPVADWRRTTRGWEPATSVSAPPPLGDDVPAISGVHPLLLALFEILLSIGALTVISPRKRPARDGF